MKSIFMSKVVQVTHLLSHSTYITQLTYVTINNKLQMQKRQPVNVTSPKLENRRQLLGTGKDMGRGATDKQMLGQHLHSFIPLNPSSCIAGKIVL
jgi:hypothetical protein